MTDANSKSPSQWQSCGVEMANSAWSQIFRQPFCFNFLPKLKFVVLEKGASPRLAVIITWSTGLRRQWNTFSLSKSMGDKSVQVLLLLNGGTNSRSSTQQGIVFSSQLIYKSGRPANAFPPEKLRHQNIVGAINAAQMLRFISRYTPTRSFSLYLFPKPFRSFVHLFPYSLCSFKQLFIVHL